MCVQYMGAGLVGVPGRTVREAGWRGRVPVVAHSGAVFPGETVPMVVADPHDAALLATAIRKDKMFGLLCPEYVQSIFYIEKYCPLYFAINIDIIFPCLCTYINYLRA